MEAKLSGEMEAKLVVKSVDLSTVADQTMSFLCVKRASWVLSYLRGLQVRCGVEAMLVVVTVLIELWEMGSKLKEGMTAKLDQMGDGSLVAGLAG